MKHQNNKTILILTGLIGWHLDVAILWSNEYFHCILSTNWCLTGKKRPKKQNITSHFITEDCLLHALRLLNASTSGLTKKNKQFQMFEYVQWNDAPLDARAGHRRCRGPRWGRNGSDGLGGGVVDQPFSVLESNRDGVDGHALALHRLPPSFDEAVHQDGHHDEDGQTQEGSYRYDNCEREETTSNAARTRDGCWIPYPYNDTDVSATWTALWHAAFKLLPPGKYILFCH